MKWKVITVGKPSFAWAREGVGMYTQRMQPFACVEMIQLKKAKTDVYLKAAGSSFVIALDETGMGLSTEEFTAKITNWEKEGLKEISVMIGGADGLPAEIRTRANLCVSFGPQTLMHELALLVWMEQLYRIYTCKNDHPYHRA